MSNPKSLWKVSMPRSLGLVTGASGGIGRAIKLELARNGFDIAANDASPSTDLDATVPMIAETGANVLPLPFDVCDLATREPALSRIETDPGLLTTIVNTAGVGVMQRGDQLDVSEASFDRCIAVNAKALFFRCEAVSRRFLARPQEPDRPRSIINITSSNATAVAVPRSEYCASKAAAAMISKCIAARVGQPNDVAAVAASLATNCLT